ncbi:hypothetical protein Tco_1069132 [Tanacetum coccineum]|uniref:Uncharacterized protein n=1 Tax=Tanacetum coccineum TaxID=301880 RepID=A0ABQ5HI44_9ASTR
MDDSGNDHPPKDNLRKDWWKPLTEEDRPATPAPAWTIPSSNVSDVENNWASTLGQDFERRARIMKGLKAALTLSRSKCGISPFGSSRWRSVTRCLQIRLTRRIQKEIKLESMSTFKIWLRDRGVQRRPRSPALSISKMKDASYPDFGLELLVPEQMWIDDVCTYDISEKYVISHWWFNRQKFYIHRHDSPSLQKEFRTYMQILSVIQIKVYSRYGDFKDLNLLLLQGHLEHLPGSDKRMLSTAVKLWT